MIKFMIPHLLKKIYCFFRGRHDLTVAYYKSPVDNYAPSSISVDYLTNEVKINPPMYIGFIHNGLVSKCNICGEEIGLDEKTSSIAIQYPELKS